MDGISTPSRSPTDSVATIIGALIKTGLAGALAATVKAGRRN
jgi:hypothetical protein